MMWFDADVIDPTDERPGIAGNSRDSITGLAQAVDLPQPWHALLTVPGSERRACIWLRMRQLEPYWPRYRTEARLQRRSKIQWRSVLPGYIFLLAPVNYGMVESGPAIRRFLRTGAGDVAHLKEADIDSIRRIAAALNDSAIAAHDGIPFKKGELVRIIPLKISGKILRIDSRRRVVISVNMFGSVVPLTVAVGDIESV